MDFKVKNINHRPSQVPHKTPLPMNARGIKCKKKRPLSREEAGRPLKSRAQITPNAQVYAITRGMRRIELDLILVPPQERNISSHTESFQDGSNERGSKAVDLFSCPEGIVIKSGGNGRRSGYRMWEGTNLL